MIDEVGSHPFFRALLLCAFALSMSCSSAQEKTAPTAQEVRSPRVQTAKPEVEKPAPQVSGDQSGAAESGSVTRCDAYAFTLRKTCPPGAPCHYKSPEFTRQYFRFTGEPHPQKAHAEANARRRVDDENARRRAEFQEAMRAYSTLTNAGGKAERPPQPKLKKLTRRALQCKKMSKEDAAKKMHEGRIHNVPRWLLPKDPNQTGPALGQ